MLVIIFRPSTSIYGYSMKPWQCHRDVLNTYSASVRQCLSPQAPCFRPSVATCYVSERSPTHTSVWISVPKQVRPISILCRCSVWNLKAKTAIILWILRRNCSTHQPSVQSGD